MRYFLSRRDDPAYWDPPEPDPPEDLPLDEDEED